MIDSVRVRKFGTGTKLHNLLLKIGIASFVLLMVLSTPGSAKSAPMAAGVQPYPDSSVIDYVNWDWSYLPSLAPGSDLWPTTWGPDGHIYASWGDGGGFNGNNSDGRVSLGFARIEGEPRNFTGINVWGGLNGENSAQFTGKTGSILSVDGTLYAWINTQNPTYGPAYRLAWSTDLGAHWQRSSWVMDSEEFALASFINFGQDYAGARDGYVYSYGGHWGPSDYLYMGRVLKENIKDINAYEYFAGFDGAGNPLWNSSALARQPVFTNQNSTTFNGSLLASVIYNPGLSRYILTIPHGTAGQWGVYDAPEPWGPWTTIDYYDNWGGYSSFSSEALVYVFSSKWMSQDGLDMWMTFSGVGGNLDAFKLIKGSIVLKDGQTTPNQPVSILSASPSSGEAPLSTAFDGSSSYDSDGNIVSYEWDFDYDGSNFDVDDSGVSSQFTFTQEGFYTVALKVTDDDQLTSIDTATINVSSQPGDDSDPPTPPSVGAIYELPQPLTLDGVDDYVDTQCCEDLGHWTVSARVSSPNAPRSSAATGPLFGEKNCCTIVWDHASSQFRGALALKVGGHWYSTSFGSINSGQEYHLAGTYDGETLKAYRDGVLVSVNGSMSGPPESEPSNVMIGRHPYASSYFEGTVSEVRIYDEALSGSEISALNEGIEAQDPPNDSPVGTIEASVSSGDAPLNVNLDASASHDVDGDIVLYEWDHDYDGSNFDVDDSGVSSQITYMSEGDYTAALRVTDDDEASSMAMVDITVNPEPSDENDPPPSEGLIFEMTDSLTLDGVNDYVDTLCCSDMSQWSVSTVVSSPNAPRSGLATGPVYGEKNCCTIVWDHASSSFRGSVALKVSGRWYSASFGQLDGDRQYHLAGTYDGETLRAYKDGVLVGQNGSMSGAPEGEAANVMLGKHPYAESYFEGTISQVKIYDRPLSVDEIITLGQ